MDIIDKLLQLIVVASCVGGGVSLIYWTYFLLSPFLHNRRIDHMQYEKYKKKVLQEEHVTLSLRKFETLFRTSSEWFEVTEVDDDGFNLSVISVRNNGYGVYFLKESDYRAALKLFEKQEEDEKKAAEIKAESKKQIEIIKRDRTYEFAVECQSWINDLIEKNSLTVHDEIIKSAEIGERIKDNGYISPFEKIVVENQEFHGAMTAPQQIKNLCGYE